MPKPAPARTDRPLPAGAANQTGDKPMDTLYRNRFRDMMNDVAAAGSCSECGSCVAVCPHGVIEYADGKPRLVSAKAPAFDHCGVSEGVGCDVCATVCPRLWPREEHLRDAVFGAERGYEGIFGVYRHIFVARTRRADVLAQAQDGGIVTALLAWARRTGRIDAAIVSTVGEGDAPCFPSPKVLTSVDDIAASGGSWYTYCPNDLALAEARERDLKRVAFVGVPCQITPLRKMMAVDPAFLLTPRKKPAVVTRQRDFLRGTGERVAFSVGLFCTEVFRPELMSERIEQRMGIPLASVAKFNVKGEILIHKKDGGVETIPLKEAMEEYQRPECRHCGDFSAEMADIACGGVGTDRATIVVLRTAKAVNLWRDFEAAGEVDVWPIAEHRRAWNILLRLARQQRGRMPPGAPRTGTAPGLPQYSARRHADEALSAAARAGMTEEAIGAGMTAAYGDEAPSGEIIGYTAGLPIPGDPGEPAGGEKRQLPPPPAPEQGGASPLAGQPALAGADT